MRILLISGVTSSKYMMSTTTQIRRRPVRQTSRILLTAFAVRRARAVERRLGERGEEVRAEPRERYGGEGGRGGHVRSRCVSAPELCKSCAVYEVRQRAGTPECEVLPCFAPRNETGLARRRAPAQWPHGRLRATSFALALAPRACPPHPDQTRRLDTRSHGRTSGVTRARAKGSGRGGGSPSRGARTCSRASSCGLTRLSGGSPTG
jgi:hypothetical protein